MRLSNVFVIFKKELVDILRDRRTLMFMVLLPILVIPGLMWVMGKFVSSGVQRLQENPSIVAVVGAEEAPSMVRLLDGIDGAAGDPAFFQRLDDPQLARGLNFMMRPDEIADAMLAAGAVSEDALGNARFIDTVTFAPSTDEGERLLANGLPGFLRDAQRLRLVAAAFELRAAAEAGEPAADETEERDEAPLDPTRLADEKRIASMSPAERAQIDADVDAFAALRREIKGGVEARDYHAVLILHDGFGDALAADGTARYSVLFDESVEKSTVARRKLTGFLDRLSSGLVRARVVDHEHPVTLLDPMVASSINIGRSRSILSIMLPYVVLLMCFAGAIYPALDLGAGEKERGTLETLLVTPAGRLELVLGKFLVITLAAMVASLLNIASLAASFKLGLMSMIGSGGLVLDPKAIIVSLVLMLPVAAFFAAILLAVSIFAKSFKEAQSYTAPINMVVILPAIVSFIPGVELTIPLSFVPLVNVSLALKEAWAGLFQWDCIAIILASSLVYAGLALAFCVAWFQREEVLFRT